jgi:uncharacterized protein
VSNWNEHSLTGSDFDDLARGLGSASAVEALGAGQISRRALLLLALSEELAARPGHHQAVTILQQAQDLLATVNAADAAANQVPVGTTRVTSPGSPSAGDRLLLHPYLEVWAVDAYQQLVHSGDRDEPSIQVAARMGYLLAGAVAVAAQVGLDVETDLIVPARGLAVPGLGRFTVEASDVPFRARLSTTSGRPLILTPDDARPVQWEPVHRFDDAVVLEDTDPYRDTFGYAVQLRLNGDLRTQWTQHYTEARNLILKEYGEYVPALNAGLVSITPLITPADGHDASAAGRQAYGAVSTALPRTSATLALLLLHEFQHVKLGALIDLVPLYDPDDDTLYRAPWRPDPRPLGALLQGTYAHLAVTDFWRRHRHTGPDPANADRLFQHWHAQTRDVIDVLATSPALNDLGRRFVAGMAAAVEPWNDESAVDLRRAAPLQHS